LEWISGGLPPGVWLLYLPAFTEKLFRDPIYLFSQEDKQMRKALLAALLVLLLVAPSGADEARLMRYPDIHGDQVVFVYAGDLWTVSSEGGVARRLTSHVGMEQFPKFSPDGTRIAFSAQYDGNLDVYVMPAMGGAPTRLTFHPQGDGALEWFPDGESILFRSRRESYSYRVERLFRVPADGGFPEALVLPAGGLTSFNEDGSRIAYNRMSREFRTWKRYRGGMAQDIWIYDFEANSIERVTDFDGTDAFPMWHGERIYFISDREHTMNIFCYEIASGEIRKVTDFDEYDVKWPSLGPDAIVFENGGYLYVLDLATEETRRLSVEVYDDLTLTRPGIRNVSRFIHSGGISPSGVRAVFEARGDIFTVPAENGDTRNLTQTPGIREISPAWSPNGRWIAYFSDRTGEYELYIRDRRGEGEETQLTDGLERYSSFPVWSPDSEKIMFSDAGVNLYYIDVETREITQIDHSDYAGGSNFFTGVWSPDSNWVAYSMNSANYFTSIYLYSLEEGRSHQITSDMTNDNNPAWDPDGRYLYFAADREFNPQFSQFEFEITHQNPSTLAVVTLQADAPSPLPPESDDEEIEEEEGENGENGNGEDEGEEDEGEEEEGEEDEGLRIDIEGIEGRILNLPVPDGNYGSLTATSDKLFFISLPAIPRFDGSPQLVLQFFDLGEREVETVIAGISAYSLSADGKKVIYASRDTYGIIDAAPGKNVGDGRLDLSGLQTTVDPRAEWRQMFYEAWRLERDFFYDPNMHGVDWQAMRERYEVLLPYLAHRDDLNYLIGELIAELCASHTYRGGGDYPEVQRVNVGLLACDFEPDSESGFYRIAKIYTGENWDPERRAPLTEPGVDVNEGDYLIAVDGRELRYPTSPWSFFQNTVGRVVTLTVNSEPSAEGAREVEVRPIANDLIHRYIDWVANNRRYVEEATEGRVGYIHVPDTAFDGLFEFSRTFFPQVHKQALIIDERFNSGGFIPNIMIDRLGRPVYNYIATRYTESIRTPVTGFLGPMVCIINHYAGSGGDALPYFFRRRGLGPLIGTRTWGGLIGISGTPPLMDNGGLTVPDIGLFSLESEWIAENRGVEPDIEVDNRPDLVVAGRDPQLEAAIEEILRLLEENPPQIPEDPPYPERH